MTFIEVENLIKKIKKRYCCSKIPFTSLKVVPDEDLAEKGDKEETWKENSSGNEE